MIDEKLEKINQKLAWLKQEPDGLLFYKMSLLHKIFVVKKESQIQMFFAEPSDSALLPKISGIMSRIDLNDALNLLGIYTQVFMLVLIFNPNPKKVFSLGFAGGRVPIIINYYFSDALINSVDIEPNTKEIAEKYFGVTFDTNQKLFLQDGEEFLKNSTEKYDLIFIDAFRGSGYTQSSLKTSYFYEICKKRMNENAVLCVNFASETQNAINEKINYLKRIFPQVCIFNNDLACVVICSNSQKISYEERVKIAEKLDKKFHFHFPFVEKAKELKDV